MDNFSEFFSIIKKKVLLEHINKIRRPLMDFKQKDIEHYDQRADFQQVLTLKDYEPHELQNLLADELDEKGDASYETKRIEKLELQIERSAAKLESQMRTFERTYEQILYASDIEEDENENAVTDDVVQKDADV